MKIKSETGLSKRILLLFIITTTVLIIQGIYNIYSLKGVNNSITHVYDSVSLISSTSDTISLPISELRQLSLSSVMSPNKALRDKLRLQKNKLQLTTDQAFKASNTLTFSKPEDEQLFNNIEVAWQKYSAAVQVTSDYVNAQKRIAAFISVTINEKTAYDEVTKAIIAFNAHQLKISKDIFKAAQESGTFAFWAVLITTTVEVIILKVILAYVLQLVNHYVDSKKQHKLDLEQKNQDLLTSNEALIKAQQELEERKEQLQSKATELEQTLEQLTSSQKKLIETEKMSALGSLVAGVAHEINTPVGVCLLGISHLGKETKILQQQLKDQTLTESYLANHLDSAQELTNTMQQSLTKTANLVSTFKQIAADQYAEEKRQFNLKRYFDSVISSLHSRFENRPITLENNVDENIEIYSFPGIFSQTLTNLIINSLLHGFTQNETGKIEITAHINDDSLHFCYQDNGKGIDKDSINRIFEPFFSTKMGQGGSGLGLNIIHSLITHKLKGEIHCQSNLGEGMKMIINIPRNELNKL